MNITVRNKVRKANLRVKMMLGHWQGDVVLKCYLNSYFCRDLIGKFNFCASWSHLKP